LPEGMVILPGQLKPSGATRSISVVFAEFAAGPAANVTLDARWTLNNVAHAERIELPIASLDSANIADGFSRALAQLADRMAAQLSSGLDRQLLRHDAAFLGNRFVDGAAMRFDRAEIVGIEISIGDRVEFLRPLFKPEDVG